VTDVVGIVASDSRCRLQLPLPMGMRSLIDSLPDCVLIIDTFGSVLFANRSAEAQLGYDLRDWFGRSVLELVHPDDVANVLSSIDAVQGKAVGTPVEVRMRDSAGAWHLYEEVGTNVVLDDGSHAILCVARNITQRRMWEVSGDDVARFQHIIQVAPAISLLLDADGIITTVNAAFTRMLGHDQSNVIGQPFTSFIGSGHDGQAVDALAALSIDGCRVAFEVPMTIRAEPGRTRPVRFEMVSHLGDPVIAGIVVSGYDVTELEVVRGELEYLARHDALTDLVTRSHLVRHIEQQLNSGHRFAVLYIDLDRFKPVNDLWGHETGDEILRQVAGRLDQCMRPLDLAARVGGDEFVVIAHGVSDFSTARAFADRLEALISQPYQVEAGPIRIGASIGIAINDDSSTVASLLADSDLAMYDSKSERRGMSARSSVERKRSALDRRRLADEFATGLTRGEIVAHLQPIIDTRTRQLIAVEALARWNHPQLGVLRPAAFIEVVADAGMDIALGNAVLESAAQAISELARHEFFPQLAINLSIGQLADPDLGRFIGGTLARHSICPEQLIVEITEQAILTPYSQAGGASVDDTLRLLHATGIQLSLDDFGTGYSSLTHVRRFPLSAIKIDQTFIAGVATNLEDRAVVEVVIGLGAALDLSVIAEGVETTAQLDALLQLGCQQAQGHLIARPMPADAIVSWIEHNAPHNENR
jgi:diguanylate cyclase (GGDEF)-like protein/PAS domain S-box-containing protein